MTAASTGRSGMLANPHHSNVSRAQAMHAGPPRTDRAATSREWRPRLRTASDPEGHTWAFWTRSAAAGRQRES